MRTTDLRHRIRVAAAAVAITLTVGGPLAACATTDSTVHATGARPTTSFGHVPEPTPTHRNPSDFPSAPDTFDSDPFDHPDPGLPGGPVRGSAAPQLTEPAG